MKINYYRIIWFIFFVQLFITAIVIGTAKVDDMTLAQGVETPFNSGWVLVRQDGSETALEKLPYYADSKPNEKVIIKNKIPEEYCGKTLSYLLIKHYELP